MRNYLHFWNYSLLLIGVCFWGVALNSVEVMAGTIMLDGRLVEIASTEGCLDHTGEIAIPGSFSSVTRSHLSTSEGSREVDVVGGTESSGSGAGRAKGNAYRIDTTVTLDSAEFFLDFSDTQTLQYYVYESAVEFGTYTQVFTFAEEVTGMGANWYSSGYVGLDLSAGMYYIIAASWSGTCGYNYNSGDSQATSFGEHVHGYAVGSHPLPASFSSTSNDFAIYYQRLTTDSGMATPTPAPTATPVPTSTPVATATPVMTPSPTAEPCIHDGDVNLDAELTAGDAQMAFLIVLGSYTPTFEQECAADCNGDEEVTAGDAQLIFLAVLGSGNCEDGIFS